MQILVKFLLPILLTLLRGLASLVLALVGAIVGAGLGAYFGYWFAKKHDEDKRTKAMKVMLEAMLEEMGLNKSRLEELKKTVDKEGQLVIQSGMSKFQMLLSSWESFMYSGSIELLDEPRLIRSIAVSLDYMRTYNHYWSLIVKTPGQISPEDPERMGHFQFLIFVGDYLLDMYRRMGEDIAKMNVELSRDAQDRLEYLLEKPQLIEVNVRLQ